VCQKLKKINDIQYSKSRLVIYLISLKGTENIPWLYDTGAQAMCLSENIFRKISKEDRTKNCSQTEGSSEQEDNHYLYRLTKRASP
jgi:hypothetical protein